MFKKFLVFLLVFWGILVVFPPKLVLADEAIKHFDVSLTAHKNGRMSVSEVIEYDFGSGFRHGIYRTIPLVTKVGDLERVISVDFLHVLRDGVNEQYTVSSGDSSQVKIGDPGQTITGVHTYTIQYEVSNGIGSNYADHDEIYWNVTGNEWTVPIEEASIVVGTDFGVGVGKTVCYTGAVGQANAACRVVDAGTGKRFVTTAVLPAASGFTIVAGFPLGTFPKSVLRKPEEMVYSDDFISFIRFLIPCYLFLNFVLGPGLLWWYLRFKKRRFGPVTVNFAIPEYPVGVRISPAEAGTIDNAKLDKDDLTATIFDLAIRKYIRIEQVDRERFLGLGAKYDYNLVRLKSFADLNSFEKHLVRVIFAGKDRVLLSEVQLEFTDYEDLKAENFDSLIHRGFYTKNPEGQMGALLGLGIFCTVTLNLVLGPVLIFLSRKLHGKTAVGEELDWKIDGLKLFLKNMRRNYQWQAEKLYVVEAMIPYAMALGYIDVYMKELQVLYPDYTPGWYVGGVGFWGGYGGFTTSFGSAVVMAMPSSSGFSGGGFSGGGGGGGGGGSW